MHWVKAILFQFLYGVLRKSVRSSFLLLGGVMLISSTGAWKYAESSFAAHDFVRAAKYMGVQATDVVTIGIDDTAYTQYFGGSSPLDREKLAALLSTIQTAAPHAQKIAIDLDISPVALATQDGLFAFLAASKQRWVLAEPVRSIADESEAARAWRHRLCTEGIALGLPYLPTEFGYLDTKQQYANSLADVVVSGRNDSCAAINTLIETAQKSDQRPDLKKIPFIMNPSYTKDGMVIPFHGDLKLLADTLSQLAPRFIVVGGVWGTTDILNTPFGDRYGVQLHAAAIDGAIKHQRALPYALNYVIIWLTVALFTIFISTLQTGLQNWVDRGRSDLPGHQFLASKLWPLFVMLSSFGIILAVSELVALFYAYTGISISTAVTAASLFAYVLFVWNFGLSEVHYHTDFGETVSHVLVDPVRTDLQSMRFALRRLLGAKGNLPGDTTFETILRGWVTAELLLATSSLALEVLVPACTMYFSILKSF